MRRCFWHSFTIDAQRRRHNEYKLFGPSRAGGLSPRNMGRCFLASITQAHREEGTMKTILNAHSYPHRRLGQCAWRSYFFNNSIGLIRKGGAATQRLPSRDYNPPPRQSLFNHTSPAYCSLGYARQPSSRNNIHGGAGDLACLPTD